MNKVWNPNIWKIATKMKVWFKKWKSWNPKGRPKKGIALCNEMLTKKWYKPATRQDIEENYMHLMNLGEKELQEIKDDEKQPMLIKVLAKNILSEKWFDVVEKMLDRWIWKAVQRNEDRLVNKDWEDLIIKTPEV